MNIRVLGLVVGMVFASNAVAKEISLEELRSVQAKLKSAEDLSVDFTQTRVSTLRHKESKRDGRALFAKPNKFKWMLETPVQEYKVYDGKDFYDYSPGSKSALRYSPTGPRSYELREIVDFVLNFDALLKRYDLVKADRDGDVIKIALKPKTAGEITDVDLHMSVAQAFVSYMKMTLKSGDSLAHAFKNPIRKKIPDDAFAIPKGVKVTDSN